MKALHVVIVSGHNSKGDGGNSVERGLTPKLAAAYLAAFKAANISAQWVNPDASAFNGLDGLASATARAIRDADAKLVIMLDLHFNGSKSGVHSIVAHNMRVDGRGPLTTAIAAGRIAADLTQNNPLDFRFAGALSKNIVLANSNTDGWSDMYLWDKDGVMLENQSGVGNNDGNAPDNCRLAMMAYPAPYRMTCIRTTVEHGGTNDAARPQFFRRCADAAVKTVKEVLGDRLDPGDPAPPPDPDEPTTPPAGDPGNPPLTAFLFGEADGYQYDPNGPVSKLWLARGNEQKRWPRLIDVKEETGTTSQKWFVFSDGSVILAAGGKVSYLGTVV